MRLTLTRFPVLRLGAALMLMGSCDSTTQYHAGSIPPKAPLLVSVDVATRSDTVPCFLIRFSNPNTENVTLRLDRAGPAGAAFEQRLRGIPGGLIRLYDEPYPEVADRDYDEYRYRLLAVSNDDSLSPPSNTLTLYLMAAPPIIDSVTTHQGYPIVHYRVTGSRGVSLRTEIVKNDTVLAFIENPEAFYDGAQTDIFDTLNLDTLKAVSRSKGDNGTYGIRVIARMSGNIGAVGLSVTKFNVFRP